MNTYIVKFKVPYGKHICLVTSNDDINALDLALHELYSKHYTIYSNEDVDSEIIKLPLKSESNKEEVLFIDGYEE